MQAMEGRLRGEMQAMECRLRGEMHAMHKSLSRDIAYAVNTVGEMLASQFELFEEKYQDLPARVTRLEAAVFKP